MLKVTLPLLTSVFTIKYINTMLNVFFSLIKQNQNNDSDCLIWL